MGNTISVEALVERTNQEIADFGNGKLEFETADIERLAAFASKFIKLEAKIAEHQLEESSDLCTIGELVLNELDMWM